MVPTISPSLWSKRRRRWEGTTRKVVISEFITLDGVIEDPGGAEGFERGGWAFFGTTEGPRGTGSKFDELMASDALLLVPCLSFSW
ncbi:MAG: hypothetical protein WB507_07200 [Solirubrobacterales bacterium]